MPSWAEEKKEEVPVSEIPASATPGTEEREEEADADESSSVEAKEEEEHADESSTTTAHNCAVQLWTLMPLPTHHVRLMS